MDYSPAVNNHGLPHDPFVALVVPRPIGWISTLDVAGVVNLAPYSFFNIVGHGIVMFSSAGRKDSQRNAEEQGEFVASIATYDLRHEVNMSSAPVGVSESEPASLGLEMAPSVAVAPPRVMRSPIALECRYLQTVALPGYNGEPHKCAMVLGQVMSVHIDDSVIVDGLVDIRRIRPITRLGYLDYAVIDEFFSLPRPTPDELRAWTPDMADEWDDRPRDVAYPG